MAVRFHAHGVDAGIRPAPGRQLFQRVGHAGHLLVVEDLRAAGVLRHPQPVLEPVDGDDALRTQQERALDGKQADRTAAPHRNRVAGLDVAHLGAHIAGGQDVRQEQDLLVRQCAIDLQRPDIGEGHTRELGLPAGKTAGQMRVTERAGGRMSHQCLCQRGVGIGVLTERPHLVLAMPAITAGNGERHHHAVPWFQVLDCGADFHYLAHELVSEDVAFLHRRHETVIEM